MNDIKSICIDVVVKYMVFFAVSTHIKGAVDYCVHFDTDTL